ncbi:hypothetical protein V1509DRAFT_626176 [Lipomyces kononenkoae]
MAKAMRMSLQDLSALDADQEQQNQQVNREGQESGVVLRPAPHGGVYNTDQWGLMALSDDRGVTQSPFELGNSRREPEVPPVLRPCEQARYLAPLLVILHSIPISRSALLLFGKQLVKDYGIAPAWWDKELIFVPEFAASPQKQEDLQRVLLLLECQRIMAFLDMTSPAGRAYSSIENLVYAFSACQQTYMDIAYSDFITDSEPIANFLKLWSLVAGQYADSLEVPVSNAMSNKLFNSWVSLDRPTATETDSTATTTMEQKFVNLELIMTEDVRNLYGSFVGALDSLLWSEEPEAYLKSVADVFVISVKQDNWLAGAGVDLPLEWYPDRYTKPFMKVMKSRNVRRVQILDEIQSLRNRRLQIAEYAGFNTKSLLDSTVEYFTRATELSTDEKTTSPTLAKLQRLTANLDRYIAEIDKKIGLLELEIRSLTEFMSEPPAEDDIEGRMELAAGFDDGHLPDFHRYSLAGVIISDSIVYFKQKLEKSPAESNNILEKKDQIDITTKTESETPSTVTGDESVMPEEQYVWMRYTFASYSDSESDSFEIRQVNAEQVIDVARSTGPDGVVAVYASDEAYSDAAKVHGIVNAGLKEFLARDNELLRQELIRSEQSIDLINLEPTTKEILSTPTSASSSSFDIDSDVDMAGTEKHVKTAPFIKKRVDTGREKIAQTVQVEREGQDDEDEDDDEDDCPELLPPRYPASPEFARRISVSGVPTSVPGGHSPPAIRRRSEPIVHSGRSGKVTVEHLEHAEDHQMADSDEEVLDRMRRR